MLVGEQFSAFHRIKSDEIWHYYVGGSPLIVYVIDKDGKLTRIKLGKARGALFQTVLKAGAWFAASLNDKKSYCLLGCTVSPGFEYRDWELGKRNELIKMYPQYKKVIEQHTIV